MTEKTLLDMMTERSANWGKNDGACPEPLCTTDHSKPWHHENVADQWKANHAIANCFNGGMTQVIGNMGHEAKEGLHNAANFLHMNGHHEAAKEFKAAAHHVPDDEGARDDHYDCRECEARDDKVYKHLSGPKWDKLAAHTDRKCDAAADAAKKAYESIKE